MSGSKVNELFLNLKRKLRRKKTQKLFLVVAGRFCANYYRKMNVTVNDRKIGAEGPNPFTVFIEGNIGSGKTTFLNHFQKFDGVCLMTEPVDLWRNCGGVNLLELLYTEPYRWAMPFQTYVTLTMLNTHTHKTDKSVKLMERSIFSARYCFVENMLKTGVLHQGMYNILQDWYEYFTTNVHIQADLIGKKTTFYKKILQKLNFFT